MGKGLGKVLVMVLCFMVVIPCIPMESETVVAVEDLIAIEDIDVDFQNRQSESIDEYKKILDSFNVADKTRKIGEQAYDNNYGGAYIDDDGELVVLLVNPDDGNINTIQTYAENSALKTEDCEYSYNELLFVIESINGNLDYLQKNGIIISEMYEDIYSNRVHIGVCELTDAKECVIREIVDSQCMVIYNQTERIDDLSGIDVEGGGEVSGNEDSTCSTLGFCAKRNGVEGFIISGHVGDVVGETYNYSGVLLGSVIATSYYNQSTADAAFVAKSSYVNTTDEIGAFKCHYLATDISDYPVGASISKYGRTTGITSGNIKNNNFTSYSDGVYFVNQTTATFKVEGGDSGGPVFMGMDVVRGQITCKLLGVVKAIAGTYGDSTYLAIFSKYSSISNELGITAITY